MNHYEVLGVAADASPKRLRAAYLAEARRHHPDFHTGDDARSRAGHAQQMQAVNEAWAVLGDPQARARYDAQLSGAGLGGADGSGASAEPQMPPGKGWTPRRDDDGWMDDFEAWAAEEDVLPDDDPGRARQGMIAVLPVGLFAIGVALGLLGVVLEVRGLLAASFAVIALSAILMVMLPVLSMAKARRGDPDTPRR